MTSRSNAVGEIAETVRTWPGAVRDKHLRESCAAIGPHAEIIMASHSLGCLLGKECPLVTLENLDARARVLLLGVRFDECSPFHLTEYRVPKSPKETQLFLSKNGEGWARVKVVNHKSNYFEELGMGLADNHSVVGAKSWLFSLPDAIIPYATQWF